MTSGVKILIAGTYAVTDAYPNVRYKVEDIMNMPGAERVVEIRRPIRTALEYRSGWRRQWQMLTLAANAIWQGIVVVRKIIRYRSFDAVYIPYPAIHILLMLRFIPKPWKPGKIVADVFISLYDTAVVDRGLWKRNSFPARLVYWLERFAYKGGALLVTDTTENVNYMSDLFRLDQARLSACPLAINEDIFFPEQDSDRNSKGVKLKVLFVGTLVPLHGIDRLCQVILRLDPSLPLEFTLVGDGQEAPVVEGFFNQWQPAGPDGIEVKWQREWVDSPELSRLIRSADLCVGILGMGGKADRVWPFKNYLYMACGKALVTADTVTARRMSADTGGGATFMVLDASRIEDIVEFFSVLPGSVDVLRSTARKARHYYEVHLSREAGRRCLYDLLIN